MWQIPCKMTNSSSKPLQTLGKWYQPRNPKKNPKPAQKKNPKTISHPFGILGIQSVRTEIANVFKAESSRHGVRFLKYEGLMLSADPSVLLTKGMTAETIGGENNPGDNHIRAHWMNRHQTLRPQLCWLVPNLVIEDNAGAWITNNDLFMSNYLSNPMFLRFSGVVPGSMTHDRNNFLRIQGISIAKKANPTAYAADK